VTPKVLFNLAWAAGSLAVLKLVTAHHQPGINLTESLPDLVYVLDVGTSFGKGDLVEFPVPPGIPDPRFNKDFVKRIAGTAGDVVEHRDGHAFVNGLDIGPIQSATKDGRPLAPGPTGVIPPGFVFVQGLNERSYDSRYQDVGLIPVDRVLGRVRVVL
jgi:conjugal transfer pilin signal peptidase TrbI